MPAKKKTSSPTTPAASQPASPKKAAARKTAVAVPATESAAEVPAVRKAVAKKAPVAEAAVPAPVPGLVGDEVARVAYLNYCSRKAKGLPDDPEGDWLAAERQLHIRE
jgi:hypothetical protein